MISNLFMQMKGGSDVDEGLIRHMVLNSIRSYRMKFCEKYGEMIIACDGYRYWRREVYPYYKANRKKSRDESSLDWNKIFEALNKIRDELKETFPYRVINTARAEADDIIAVLCEENGYNIGSRILIISGDKDFIQLQRYPAVDQYDPIRKKWLNDKNPDSYLAEHIITGDVGDGVPNALSADDCLVLGKKQTTLTSKRKEALLKGDYSNLPFSEEIVKRNLARNKQLIDMSEIPADVKKEILDQYESQENKKAKDLFGYFVKHKLKNLMTSIGDF